MHIPASTTVEIASEVRAARKAQRLRQDELALAAGVSTRLIHQIENGKPGTRLDGLVRVLDALGLELGIRQRELRITRTGRRGRPASSTDQADG